LSSSVWMFLRISPNKNQREHMYNPSFSDRQRDAADFVTPLDSPNPIWCSRSRRRLRMILQSPSPQPALDSFCDGRR
jgi:hypothetical protein